MRMAFGRAIAGYLHCNGCTKSADVFHAWNMSAPSFVRSHLDFPMIDAIIQVTSILNSVALEFSAQRAAVQKTADHISQCPMRPFTLSVLGRVIGFCGFQDVPSSHDCSSELLRSCEFTTLVRSDVSLSLVFETVGFEEHLQRFYWRVLSPSKENP